MKRSPVISVVITTCNRSPSVLKRALESVYSQTYAASKIVIIDTNTNSALSSAICDYIKSTRRSNLELIHLPGKSNNYGRNHGATLAKGDYIAFLDDDDEWAPQKLESQIRMIDDNVSMVYSNYKIENSNGDVISLFDYVPKSTDLNVRILGENIIGCTSMPLLSSRAFFEVGCFDESFESNQEWDLWIRIVMKQDAKYCPEVAGIKHHSRECISNNKWRRASGWIRLFMKHAEKYRENPEQLVIATGFFNNEMFNKKMYLTGTIALMIHVLFKAIYLRNDN